MLQCSFSWGPRIHSYNLEYRRFHRRMTCLVGREDLITNSSLFPTLTIAIICHAEIFILTILGFDFTVAFLFVLILERSDVRLRNHSSFSFILEVYFVLWI